MSRRPRRSCSLKSVNYSDAINCSECGDQFKCLSELAKHCEDYHSMSIISEENNVKKEADDNSESSASCEGSVDINKEMTRKKQKLSFTKDDSLPDHVNYERDMICRKKSFRCKLCDKVYREKRWLISHLNLSHYNYLPFKCDNCSRAFPGRKYFSDHKCEHNTNSEQKLSLSNSRKRSSIVLQDKTESKRKRRLTNSLPMESVSDEAVIPDKTENESALCDIIDNDGESLSSQDETQSDSEESESHVKDEKKKKNLYFTEQTSIPDHVNYDRDIYSTHKKNSSVKCKLCDQSYATRRSLIFHLNSIHYKYFPYKCDICDREFAAFRAFDKHACDPNQKNVQRLSFIIQNSISDADNNQEGLSMNDKNDGDDPRTVVIGCKISENDLQSDEKSPQTCPLCDSIVDDKRNLIHHISSIHSNHCHHHCENCDMKFITLAHLNLHVREKHSTAHYQCDQCDARYNFSTSLATHKQVHHSTIKFKCSQCDKTFKSDHYLKQHFLHVHRRKIEKHFCQICQKGFVESNALRRHELIRHSSEFPFPCGICDRKFKTSNRLFTHVKSCHSGIQFKCDICEKDFAEKKYLEHHKRTIHAPESERRRECEYCHKSFTIPSLRNHINTVHKRKKPYSCTLCHSPFVSKYFLSVHMRRHNNERPHSCVMCHLSFREKAQLNRHVKDVHCGVTYRCDICDKTFPGGYALSAHKRSHWMEKKEGATSFVCQICDKGFRSFKVLSQHEIVHTGEKPFECEICRKRFTAQQHLTRHRNTVHDDHKLKVMAEIEKMDSWSTVGQ